ncbi:hypothetical protein FACS1894189_7460 [Planctomycetales bacterium]|nr:hypothetical protein FACS1894189_7460 [Planctomycetales bacterium]
MQATETPPIDAVEMIRAIRDKHYEETKNMTWDEIWEYNRKKVESFDRWAAQVRAERVADANK